MVPGCDRYSGDLRLDTGQEAGTNVPSNQTDKESEEPLTMGDTEDDKIKKQLVEDVLFLQGMFVSLCPEPEIRRIFIFGMLKLRMYIEGNLTEDVDEKSLTEELMRSYQ